MALHIYSTTRSIFLLARSEAWTSENTTSIRPTTQTPMPRNFLNPYFVFRNTQVRTMTHGIDQQSNSITLVKDVYWYDFTTAQANKNINGANRN